MVTKLEWDVIKKRGCAVCGKSDVAVGGLEKAHLKAKSKNGTQVIPMCPTHHKKFDKGLLKDSELEKIGIDPEKYKKYLPKKGSGTSKPKTAIEEYEKAQKETAKKMKKANDETKKIFGRRLGLI
jgi:predicted restriction endonuclease